MMDCQHNLTFPIFICKKNCHSVIPTNTRQYSQKCLILITVSFELWKDYLHTAFHYEPMELQVMLFYIFFWSACTSSLPISFSLRTCFSNPVLEAQLLCQPAYATLVVLGFKYLHGNKEPGNYNHLSCLLLTSFLCQIRTVGVFSAVHCFLDPCCLLVYPPYSTLSITESIL